MSAANTGSGGQSTGDGGAGQDDGPISLGFDDIPQLAARERITLHVRVKPAGTYRVRFALPNTETDPLDAVLDRSEAETDANGVAEVVLTAPSTSGDFYVRASIDGDVSGKMLVSVKDSGFTSVIVQPTYKLPLRNIEVWTATVHTEKSCTDLEGVPPEDGPLSAKAARDDLATVTGVPALTRLAVTLRSGHYLGGCASVDTLPAGGAHVVQVTVLNRPIDLSASKLSLSLGLAEPAATWQDFLSSAGTSVEQALSGTSSGDVDTLLDAMRSAAGDAQQALETTRKNEGWDALLANHWGSGADSKLKEVVRAWLSAGRERLTLGEHVIEGRVTLPAATDAELELDSVAGVTAARAGFASPSRISWGATSDDQVMLSTDIYVVGSRMATGLAEAAALELDDDASSASQALSTTLDCPGIATLLTTAGSDNAVAYAGCDASCMQTLCEKAASSIWQRGRDATALAPARLLLSATGLAYVGDAAEIAGISGNWIGILSQGTQQPATGGSLKAAALKD